MKRILIVEDEQDIQELLEAYLGDAGYETATAGDGIEAVSRFQQEAFDLVLLDVMLPKLDGFGVCELIRRQSRARRPPPAAAPPPASAAGWAWRRAW